MLINNNKKTTVTRTRKKMLASYNNVAKRNLFKYCFIETGADYYEFNYISTVFKVARYYAIVGIKL